ncbi:hypothetical protein ACFV2Q_04925 [Streptomyces sp. NPDC059650]|uniref:hypothetical protein n=1 Tax=Streptomyces sp. NPDC059650 TaxID=3346896 RepID=UPI0036C31FCD
MSASDREAIRRTAARAALGVPGVIALQPALAERLALAASRVHEAAAPATRGAHEGAGVRCELAPTGEWHLEVRCIVDGHHRVVDVARQVRADVRAAVGACRTQPGAVPPLTIRVVVSVTRTV